MSTHWFDDVLPSEMTELLEVEVIVEVLVNRLQLLQHATVRVGAIVMDCEPTSCDEC